MDEEKTEDQSDNAFEAPRAANGRIIAGVGASAGGLEAFQLFLRSMPPHPRIALIFVQHLDPKRESLLPELLARESRMPVRTVTDGTPVEPGHVYVMPPNASLTLHRGVLHLGPRRANPEFAKPIDGFMASLAQDQGDRAVGIILSGTGSDGVIGLRAIKKRGGTTIVQLPESAGFDSMPQSAIAAGLADHVLPPDEMPEILIECAVADEEMRGERDASGDVIARICELLRRDTGHDFGLYKRNTLVRRINRRMDSLGVTAPTKYAQRLEEDSNEIRLLFQEMLIGVTAFFRDPKAFDAIERRILPRILDEKRGDEPVRLWVAGCSTGEEAYSLAILLSERLTSLSLAPRVLIFATDIDEEALEAARKGRFPESIRENVSAERLERFFAREEDGYRVNEEIRRMCVFSKHDALRDPSFPALDLISCRNLLIYLISDIQAKVIGLFHYALRPGGFLFLGAAENIAGRANLFEPVDRSLRIYRRRDPGDRAPAENPPAGIPALERMKAMSEPESRAGLEANLLHSLERAILDEFTPSGMVVREDGDVAYLFGPADKWMAPSSGAPSLNAVSMARKELRLELRGALHQAARERAKVTRLCRDAAQDGVGVNLIVRPFVEAGAESGLFLVIFQESEAVVSEKIDSSSADESVESQLSRELRDARERLQMTVDEMEATNQELQSANEELLSMNEELQSSNEELQSSKEEAQSVNAELESVNIELTRKIEDLDTAMSDLESLFEGTQIATLFLDNDLFIKRFTPTATELFRLREGDAGRPVTDITARFTNGDMEEEIREVLRSLQRKELSVRRTDDDTRFLMRILPYRTRRNVIDGVVIAFVDVTELERTMEELHLSEERYRLLFERAREGIIVFSAEGDETGRIVVANAAAAVIHGYEAEDLRGLQAASLESDDGGDHVMARLERMLQGEWVPGECDHRRKDGSLFPAAWHAGPLLLREKKHILVFCRDITERREAEEARRLAEARLQQTRKLESLTTLAGGVAHDFNNLLTGIMTGIGLVLDRTPAESPNRQHLLRANAACSKAAELSNQMLAYSGKGQFVIQSLNLSRLAQETASQIAASFSETTRLRLDCDSDAPVIQGSESQIRQLVTHLVTNAAEAIGDRDGEITIQVRRLLADRELLASFLFADDLTEGAYAALVVSDTGGGMDAETMARIFEPFFSTKFTGRGLGMAVAEGIVKGHRGAIRIESMTGRGTQVTTIFPASAKSESPREPAAPTPASAIPLSPADTLSPPAKSRDDSAILVIDDEEWIRDMAHTLLGEMGFTVLTARDGEEGAETFQRNADRISVVLLDLSMPRMSGAETLDRIRSVKPTVHVILSSGYSESEVLASVPALEDADFLQKPYRIKELVEIIERAMAKVDQKS